jgi:lipopolysaccharide cholinephosphotransferase
MNKTLCNLICCFIPKKKNRHHFRKKHLKNGGSLNEINNELNGIKRILKASVDIQKIPAATGHLKMIQDGSIAILSYFDRLCKKHNIIYWLDSGTLIGYERHNGFIPWDDDLDICMMREDYEKLPSLLDKEFKKDGFFWRGGEIIQLFYKSSPAWVDIFPVDSGNTVNPPKGKDYENFVKNMDYIKSHSDFNVEKWQKRQQTVSDSYLNFCFQKRDELLVPNKIKNGFLFIGVETGVKNRCCWSYSDVFPLKKVSFYGIQTYKPNNTPFYLFLQYGDWMVFPDNYATAHGESLANKINAENYKDCQELIELYYPKERESK